MQKIMNETRNKYVGANASIRPQNENNKYKIVGANCVRQNSRGITLIALIITIIVMIILVAVTVSVALNGGLFQTAQKAAEDTEYQADYEILQAGVVSAMVSEEGISNQSLIDNLPTEWNVIGAAVGPFTATSSNGDKFNVSSDGTITYRQPSTGDLLLLEKYFLGENGEGKDLADLVEDMNVSSPTDLIFINDDNTIPDAKEQLSVYMEPIVISNDGNDGSAFFYIRFNNNIYQLYIEGVYNGKLDCKDITLIYEKKGREGEKVKYDSNSDGIEEDWMVLYDNGDTLEIVSILNLGELTLGTKDAAAQTPGDIDKDGVENTDIDKAIYSYNNAINRLNNYCASLVTNSSAISVRSIGSNPDNPSAENNKLYESEDLKQLNPLYNGIAKDSDNNYVKDLLSMLANEYTNSGEKFWIASRRVNNNTFYIWNAYYPIEERKGLVDDYNWIWKINKDGSVDSFNTYSNTYGVRPVVKVNSNEV